MTDEILKTVKILRGITDTEQDGLLSLYIDMAIQAVLNYCNIRELPEALKYVVANMVVDEIKLNNPDDANSPVRSVSEGARTVSFDNTLLQSRLDDRVKNMEQLNRYKSFYRF